MSLFFERKKVRHYTDWWCSCSVLGANWIEKISIFGSCPAKGFRRGLLFESGVFNPPRLSLGDVTRQIWNWMCNVLGYWTLKAWQRNEDNLFLFKKTECELVGGFTSSQNLNQLDVSISFAHRWAWWGWETGWWIHCLGISCPTWWIWDTHGYPLPWESHGKVMGKSWETMDVSYGFSSCLIMFDLLILLGIRGLPSGKLSHNYGKSPFFMGKSTISMAIFNSKLLT